MGIITVRRISGDAECVVFVQNVFVTADLDGSASFCAVKENIFFNTGLSLPVMMGCMREKSHVCQIEAFHLRVFDIFLKGFGRENNHALAFKSIFFPFIERFHGASIAFLWKIVHPESGYAIFCAGFSC